MTDCVPPPTACEVLLLESEDHTLAAGTRLATALQQVRRAAAGGPLALVVALQGTLGAGKTTLVRATLRGLGWSGRVPSPTYTLVEQYEVAGLQVAHLDLYRIADPDELDALGARELLSECDVAFVEWPQRGHGWLPPAGLRVTLALDGDGRRLTAEAAQARWMVLARALCAVA